MFKTVRFRFLKAFATVLAIALGSLGFAACYGVPAPINISPSPSVSASPSPSASPSVSPKPSA